MDYKSMAVGSGGKTVSKKVIAQMVGGGQVVSISNKQTESLQEKKLLYKAGPLKLSLHVVFN